ncbi:MAG: hypothetical protein WCE36_22180 [Pseudolabrys sp.]
MKDQLITILEAIRLAKAELRTHNSRLVKNAPPTLKRLEQILFNENVTRALGLLSPDVDGPSMVPDQHEEYSP